MGFDNECILNIQSLAGEYFCPVCRLLVYPHEALQSQCTHLYCKPCLTYIVSTTRACPYDGYLVTEADSKPLVESNKTLAETIGKVSVHCLYHRSGCTWQGPLSDCVNHCSGCAFGNSAVLCNRCGIQLVHRQVQEHAQTCPGVQSQAQQVDSGQVAMASGMPPAADQTQSAPLSGTGIAKSQSLQSVAVAAPGQDPNQQAHASSQSLAAVQAPQPTPEQLYQQQQQQYQQYYQQYAGYDPYQQQYQHYYPYQQQTGAQFQQPQLSQAPPSNVAGQQQPQAYMQPQPQSQPQTQVPVHPQPQSQPQTQPHGQPQPHMHPQAHAVGQSQNQVPVNPQQQQQQLYHAATSHSQIQLQSHTQAPGQPQPQAQPHAQALPLAQPHAQALPLAQPHAQTQAKALPQAQPQTQPQPYSHVHPNSQQLVHMPQYQAQIQQQAHPLFHPQQHHPVSQLPSHSQAPAQHHSQLPNSHNSQPLSVTVNAQPQTQHPPGNAAAGYHSYPQPQNPQPMHLGASQNTLPTQPQGGAHPQLHQSVQMQAQLPQPPPMRPSHLPAMYQNQQQAPILPSPGQVMNVSAAQQLRIPSQAQPSAGPGQIVNQRPVMQVVQQSVSQQVLHHQQHFGQQGQFMQHQLPVTSHLRPPGPPSSLPQHNHGYANLPQNASLPHGMQHNQSQNLEGRSVVPNHGVQSVPYSQLKVGVQVRPSQPGANAPTTKQGSTFGNNNQVQLPDGLGERKLEKQVDERAYGSSTQKDAMRDTNNLDPPSNSGADAVDFKTEKSEVNLKVSDAKGSIGGDKSTTVDASAENTPQFKVTGPDLIPGDNGKSLTKPAEVKVEAAESSVYCLSNDRLGEDRVQDQKDLSTEPKKMEDSVVESKEAQEGSLQKISSSQDTELCEEQSKRTQSDASGIPHPSSSAVEGSQPVTTTSSLILGSPESSKPKLLNQHSYQELSQTASMHGPGNESYRGSTLSSQVNASGLPQPSHPASVIDHTRHQAFASNYMSSALQPGATTPMVQAPPPGPFAHVQMPNNPAMQFRPRAPGLVAHPGQPFSSSEQLPPGGNAEPGQAQPFGRGPGHGGHQQALDFLSSTSRGSYIQGQLSTSQGLSRMYVDDPVGGHFRAKLPGAFGLRGPQHAPEAQIGFQRPVHPMEPELFSIQRPRPDSHLHGSVEHRPQQLPGILPNMLALNGAPGHDSSKLGLRDERFKLQLDEPSKTFPLDAARRPISKMESEDVFRQFPKSSHLDSDFSQGIGNYSLRPFDRGSHGPNYDTGLTSDGAAGSRFLPPYNMGATLHHTDAERPTGFYEDSLGQPDHARGHSDLLGPGGFGRRLVDGFAPRSPLHEYRGQGFGGHPGFPSMDEIEDQEFPRRFGDPLSFHESRFPIFRSHLQRGEFEGPDIFRMGEHVRSGDLIGQDRHFGPRRLPGHLRLGEPDFGSHPGHSRVGELSGLRNFEQFGGGHRPSHPRLGEPGFRSSFSRQGLADDGRFYAGDLESFDYSRKRRTGSMGWCRICKVDCETVEGLDLHSQTREHQKMAMDIVLSIKQNAKKQKLTPSDPSSLEDASKSKNVGIESRGKKH